MKVTIDLPDELRAEFLPREELAGIVEAGLRRRRLRSPLLRDLAIMVEKLAAAANGDSVAGFKVSDAAQSRMEDLLEKNREGELTPKERLEWEEFERLEYLVRAAKTAALARMP